MATTLIFAELLITGIQVSIWIFILVVNVFGTEWMATLDASKIKDWQTLLAIIGLSIVYVLGIVFDRLADSLFLIWDRRIAKNKYPDIESFSILRFEVGKDNPDLSAQFEYTRSRLRLSRSTALNFAIITVLLIIFGIIRLPDNSSINRVTFITFVGITGSLLTLFSVYAWHRLMTQHFNFLQKYSSHSKSSTTSKKTVKAIK
ncbi:MAG: hypothetical protein AB1750_09920 [Chloroflexota bacterium]